MRPRGLGVGAALVGEQGLVLSLGTPLPTGSRGIQSCGADAELGESRFSQPAAAAPSG